MHKTYICITLLIIVYFLFLNCFLEIHFTNNLNLQMHESPFIMLSSFLQGNNYQFSIIICLCMYNYYILCMSI